MLPRHSLIVIWLVSCTTTAVFHRRGSANDTAPYFNVTALITQSSVTTISLPDISSSSSRPSRLVDVDGIVTHATRYAQPTGVGLTSSSSTALLNITHPIPSAAAGSAISNSSFTASSTSPYVDHWTNATYAPSSQVSNATCTINVPNASIDYWHPPTYSHPLGTMTTRFANYSKTESYTLVAETAAFDAASALVSVYACTWSESYVSDWDFTYTMCMEYTDRPTVAITSLVYRTAAAPFPPEGSIPVSAARSYDLYSELPVATHPLAVAPNRTVNQISATPYVYFTAYEIASGNKTRTVQLPSTYAYPYGIERMDHEASAIGSIPEDFLERVSRTDCDAGQLQATITVLIVVDLYYVNWPDNQPFIVHFESTALGFDDVPVVINNDGTARPAQFTMDMGDWGLPDVSAKSTPASVKPSFRVAPAPTSRGSNNNDNQAAGSNESQVPNVPQPTRVTVGNVGTIPIILQPSSIVVVGSQTMRPGQPAVIVGGVTPVSLVLSATDLVVGGWTTINLPQVFVDPAQQPARPPPLISIGPLVLTPNAATQFFIAPSQTLTPGGTATVDGTMVSLALSALFVVVGTSTQVLSRGLVTASPPQIVVGSTTIPALLTRSSSGSPDHSQNTHQNGGSGPLFVVGEQLLVPGGQSITVSGTTLSLVPGGASVVINGVTSAVMISRPVSVQPAIAIGNSIFTPIASTGNIFVIAGQTLAPGGQAITVSGKIISLAPSASFVVVDGVTSVLVTPVGAGATAQITPPALAIGNGVFYALPGPGISYLVESMTLTPGGIITVADSTISLAPDAAALIINGQTSIITPSQPIITNAPLLTIGSQTYTAVFGTTFIIGGQSLTPGGAITFSGTTISLALEATQLVYGGSGRSTTTALFPATTTRDLRATRTTTLSADVSGRNGEAAATTQREGSASTISGDNIVLSFFITALGLHFLA